MFRSINHKISKLSEKEVEVLKGTISTIYLYNQWFMIKLKEENHLSREKVIINEYYINTSCCSTFYTVELEDKDTLIIPFHGITLTKGNIKASDKFKEKLYKKDYQKIKQIIKEL